jgi:hypothetical protein
LEPTKRETLPGGTLFAVTDDLHPYDGQERCFRHDDMDPSRRARGRALVAKVLSLVSPPLPEGLRYDLRFYSGGIGVQDRLHVALPLAPADVDAVVARLGMQVPDVVASDETWGEDLLWLVQDEDDPRPLREAVERFVAKERADFQPSLGAHGRVWFDPTCSVNGWSVLYEADGDVCLIVFDQG